MTIQCAEDFEVSPPLGSLIATNELPPNVSFLGRVRFAEARVIQAEAIARRTRSGGEDCIICCEHPPTLSLGPRTKDADVGLRTEEWQARGVEVVKTDRGGGPTLHVPGQLLLYPVISLRARNLGVRNFVDLGLRSISHGLQDWGVCAEPSLEQAGVWTNAGESKTAKIAAVGLRVRHGVSDHGFSINISCHLEPFSWFNPCGLSAHTTTVQAQMADKFYEKHLVDFIRNTTNSMLYLLSSLG